MSDDRVPRRRADAERSRAALVAAAARQLAAGPLLDMQRLAADAGVGRSTLYRHFDGPDEVRAAVVEHGVHAAAEAVQAALATPRPPLAQLRDAVDALVRAGAEHGLVRADGPLPVRDIVVAMAPLFAGLTRLAGFDLAPPAAWSAGAAAHFVGVCLRAAAEGDDVATVADGLFAALTAPLDRGMVVLDPSGRLLGANPAGREALSLRPEVDDTAVIAPGVPAFYEDGTRCPPEAYPLARAVLTGESQEEALRGHRREDGTMRWYLVRVAVLAGATGPHGIVALIADVTDEREASRRLLPPTGTLGRREPVALDVARVLDAVPAQLLPDQIVAEARRLTEVPVALYVVDIDGTHLLRLAGTDEFPAKIPAPLALGPELDADGIPGLRDRLARELPGAVMAPMWLRGRAVGILLAFRGRADVLEEVARQAAPAMELANGYTDVFDAVRRRKDMNPAAEIQQSLLPPRIARLGGGTIAGGVLPSYDTGGDWFDYVENRDGAWLAIADASGRGAHAAALGSVALAALRASRRNDASLEETLATMHATMCSGGESTFFLTALVARWEPVYASLSWINAGHPPPLLLGEDGTATELVTPPILPLGLGPLDRPFRRSYRRLAPGDRIVLYTDGVSLRPVGDGAFGVEGIAAAAASAASDSPSAIARSIQEQVVAASERPLRDDAAVVVLAPTAT
jgi:AcrR family transcriptional regulator